MKSRLKMSYNSGHQQTAAAAAAAAAAAQAQNQLSSAAAAQAQQQYCLKWNNHTNNMVKVFNELLGDENFVDVTLACDGLSIKAHKLVLSACSTYFRDLFINNPCKHPIVILKDMRYEDLRAIIHFMYSGEVNVSYTQLGPLLKTAEALKVKGLTDVNEKHGGSFFGNGGSKEMNGSDGVPSMYNNNRMADMDGSVGGSPFGGVASPSHSPVPGAGSGGDPSNQYLAFMAQRFRKRKRKHHKNGSALALANMLGQNGNFAAMAAAAAAAVTANGVNGTKNGTSGQNGLSPTKKMLAHDPDDNNESGDEVNSAKRVKDSNSSNDDSTVNQDDPKSPSSSYHNSSNNSHNNTHLDENEMMAMALSMARSQNGHNDDDDDDRDDGTMNGDGDHTDGQMPNDSMMMDDSDDEFYTDVKPIVSLDESPSPNSNSNMDDSSYSNSFVTPILENSLAGISPGSQLPNSSTKMCVCHLCHLTFTAYSSLRRHMTRHYADRERYECDICLKSYSRKDYLKEHKKLKHSDVAKVMNSQKAKGIAAAAAAAAAAAGSA